MTRTWIDAWQRLAARERGFLAGGAAFVVSVAVYLVLWEPAASGVRRLTADLPQLQTQFAAMRAMADEAARLRAAAGNASPIAPGDVNARVAAVRRSLDRAGLASAGPVAPAAASAAVQTLSIGGPVTTVAAAPGVRAAPPDVVADGDRVRVRFDDIDYGVWVAWLAAAETELAAHAARVTVAANAPKGPVGHVRAETWLDWTAGTAAGRP